MRLIALFLLFLAAQGAAAQHPRAFATRAELVSLRGQLARYPLLQRSYTDLKGEVDAWLGKDVDVPFPKDPAGGYTHDRHKANYTLIFNAGLLYQLTGDARYAALVRSVLLKYAVLNPTLKNHPEATSSSPGRIFWQALNDANWLVYAGMAYDLVQPALSAADRKTIADGALRPEVDFVTKDLKSWFDLIHNHGVWACAGVGIAGIATDNNDWVEMALYGTDKNRKSGFVAQLDGLFSPDGYYTEGPYYVRYAILPFYMFANALHKAKPELKIFQHRDQILRKALEAGLQQTNSNGVFLPFNDILKDKDYTSSELVTAIAIARDVYGPLPGLAAVAQKQDRVILHRGGALIAADLAAVRGTLVFPYKSVSYTDGARGDEGGISLMRSGGSKDLTTVVFKYASHGLSHGHYDQLGISLFDRGSEVLQDYGSVRFVGVEQKFGGRYLPENKSWAAQTIAHSTLVVDEASHFNANETIAGKYHAEKLYSSDGTQVQAVSAKEDHAYGDVKMRRSLYLLQLPGRRRLLVDLFGAQSATQHQYDLPYQYGGQLIQTSFPYKTGGATQKALGTKNGYQFLWKEAEASVKDTVAQFTFLNNRTYYTISSLVRDSATILLVRSGANDPSFNLRREPAYILRKRGGNETFFNIVEIHGQYDPVAEFSYGAYPSVRELRLLRDDATCTVAAFRSGNDRVLVLQSNADFDAAAKHETAVDGQTLGWTGPFAVLVNGRQIQ
ncbi:heparinase [Flaviaesturariibacter flavus]|uniref:Heparinase n=1 Tax=Flaviaesturariibacter flavus TaxID=2502780 RepID=A0A4R1BK13_9BACT|nr:heparinase II/III family protein [Flaviaesturariibacter flavus]TCJ17700.1 heparinase [Flaviaesturariibacter flavus]